MPSIRRVGLNVLFLVPGEVGGSEVYVRELLPALAAARADITWLAFANREGAASLRKERWPSNIHVVQLPVSGRHKPLRAAAELTLLPTAAARAGVDLLHSLGTTSPRWTGATPSVVTVLDLIYEEHPSTFPRASRIGLKALVGPGARAARRIIAISEAVKRDVVDRLRVPAERIDAVYLGFGMQPRSGSSEDVARERLGLGSSRLILCVSAALAHKNLSRLIDAFAALGPGFEDCRLVLVGHGGLERSALESRARTMAVPNRVSLTGWITEEDLEGLYAAASCCAYPSLYEGFGLPVLEAMQRGVPVACSNATSLPEIAGDAAEFFDPLDIASMRDSLRRLLTDDERAKDLIARGRRRAAEFTWERCAEGTLASYFRALA